MTELFRYLLPAAIFTLLTVIAIAAVVVVTEFRMIRKGGESYVWAYWLWNNVPWIRKVRW